MPHLAVPPQNRNALTMNVHCSVWMTCPCRRDQSMRTCIPDHHEIGGNEQSNVSKAMSNKLSKRRYFPTSLLRPSQHTNSPNTNRPTALPLQNKGGLLHDDFIARRGVRLFSSPAYELVTNLSSRLSRIRSTRQSTQNDLAAKRSRKP